MDIWRGLRRVKETFKKSTHKLITSIDEKQAAFSSGVTMATGSGHVSSVVSRIYFSIFKLKEKRVRGRVLWGRKSMAIGSKFNDCFV